MGKLKDFLQSNFSSTCPSGFGVCLTPEECWDDDTAQETESRIPQCWILVIVFLSVGGFLILLSEIYGDPGEGKLSTCFTGILRNNNVDDGNDDDDDDDGDRLNKAKTQKFLSSPFTNTTRTEENFCRNHQDPDLKLPSDYGPEYNPTAIGQSILPLRGFRPTQDGGFLIRSRSTMTVCLGSLGVAFVCSAFSTVLWLMVNYEETCLPGSTTDEEGTMEVFIQETARTCVALIQGYVFFPVFLLVGYISFIANRWRDWMVNSHAMQGNIHDIGMICGGSFTKPPSLEQRKSLYNIYRHLNAAHALCYKSVSESLNHLDLDDFCDELALLTSRELRLLYPYPSKVRDAVLTKLTTDVALLCEADNVAVPHGHVLPFITSLRGRMARHHDLFVRDNPNLYLNLMFWVVNTLIFFTIISYPFILYLYMPSSFPLLPCFQPATLIGVFLVMFSYRSAFSMICRLRNPFSWTRDRIKVDMLLASTDMCLFTILRSGFDEERRRQPSMTTITNIKPALEESRVENENINGAVDDRRSAGLQHIRKRSVWSQKNIAESRRRMSTVDKALRYPKGEFLLQLEDCRES